MNNKCNESSILDIVGIIPRVSIITVRKRKYESVLSIIVIINSRGGGYVFVNISTPSNCLGLYSERATTAANINRGEKLERRYLQSSY